MGGKGFEFSNDYLHLAKIDWHLNESREKVPSGDIKGICLNWWCQHRLFLIKKIVFALQCAKENKNAEASSLDKDLEKKVLMWFRYNWQGKWMDNPNHNNDVFNHLNVNDKLLDFVNKFEENSSYVGYTRDKDNNLKRRFNKASFYKNKDWFKEYYPLYQEVENFWSKYGE